jgi:hypothetical protein
MIVIESNMPPALSAGELGAALMRYATTEFAPKTVDGTLPASVQHRVNLAVVKMTTAERTTQADLDEAELAFSHLVAECVRQSSADGRTHISAKDFENARHSQAAKWPFAL